MLERMQRQHRSGKLPYLFQVAVGITQHRLRIDRLKVQQPAAVCGSQQITTPFPCRHAGVAHFKELAGKLALRRVG